jgi:hypothetical protein
MKTKNRIWFCPLIVMGLVLILTNSCKKDDKDKNDIPTVLVIGQNFQGGIIAYILQPDNPGYDAKKQHGLIISTSDQGHLVLWSNGNFTVTGATATALGTGNANTNTIIASQGEGNYAAKICYDLVSGDYSDWYLPSLEELGKMYINRVAIGIPTDNEYWSSTEINLNGAWSMYFGNGSNLPTGKDFPDDVRAVRSF